MSDGREAGRGDESSPFPDCPHCGDPVLFAVVTGPSTSTVEPCGCSAPPDLFERLLED